jgi:cystathionine beta-synthase
VTPDDDAAHGVSTHASADVSQLLVLADGVLAGVIDESDVLLKVHADPDHFGVPVADAMTDSPSTLPPAASLEALRDVLDRGLVAIIADAAGFHGLITRVDLINHLRRTLK